MRPATSDCEEAVLEAYLIADDKDAVYQLAVNARTRSEFENAVEMLGAMGATEELRALRDRPGAAEVLIQAYRGRGRCRDPDRTGDRRQRSRAPGAGDPRLGIAGGSEVGNVLVDIYQTRT